MHSLVVIVDLGEDYRNIAILDITDFVIDFIKVVASQSTSKSSVVNAPFLIHHHCLNRSHYWASEWLEAIN